MADPSNTFRRVIRVTAAAWLCALGGCAGGSPLSGRRILADLERDRIPQPGRLVPDARGEESTRPLLPVDGPVTLADLIDLAEARNPDLAAARSEVGVAAGSMWQASLYPNPRLDVLAEDISWREGVEGSKTTVGVTQPIILGGRRAAAIHEAEAARAARLAAVEGRRRELFGEIAGVFARLISLREQQRLTEEVRQVAERTLATAKARFEARAAPETDVIRPRVELHRLDAELGRIGEERRALARRLGLLLGGGADVDAAHVGGDLPMSPPRLDAEHLDAAVRAGHPALLVADHEVAAAEARLERARAERTPDLDLRLAAGYRGESDEGIVEAGAGMTVPLWDAREGSILAARFEVSRARQGRSARENELLARLADAVGAYEAARAPLDAFRERIIPDAQRAFDLTAEAYRAGRASFLDMLDAQRTLAEARIALIELAGAAAAARARITQIVGPEGPDSFTIDERPRGAEVSP